MKSKGLIFLFALLIAAGNIYASNIINIDFNSGVDSYGNSTGVLHFIGTNGFNVYFTDDDSNGSYGGDANGVHITNQNAGNIKVGSSTDLVLGAYNNYYSSSNNYHSSGIIATFNQGATKVSFDDTDDDGTLKALFAYDQYNNLIGQSVYASQQPVVVDTSMTGGVLIYKVEFDTLPGTSGGSYDGTYFTIDNFYAEADPTQVAPPPGITLPEPGTYMLLLLGLAGIIWKRKRQ